MKELTPQQKFDAENPETMVPRALMEGRPVDDIVADLEELDWSPDAARALVARVANDLDRYHSSPESRSKLIREARNQFVGGILMVILGLCFTVITAIGALGGVLSFVVVTFGMMLVGLAISAKSWGRWQNYRKGMMGGAPRTDGIE